jgi:hypothetical protein
MSKDKKKSALYCGLCAVGSFAVYGRVVAILAILFCSCWGQASLRPAIDPLEWKIDRALFKPYDKARLAYTSVTFPILYAPTVTLTPGTGFTGDTAQPAAVGDSLSHWYTCKSIARWTMVPYESFSGTLNVGLVAFHGSQTDRRVLRSVQFSVNGGEWVPVTRMRRNPRTNLVEYVAVVDADDFDPGPIEIRAIANPQDGVPRVLEPLYLTAQPAGGSGQYFSQFAYVSTSGNDGTGVVSATPATASASRFATIGAAMLAIQAERLALFGLADCDYGVVRLTPEVHAWNMVGGDTVKVSVGGWLRVESMPGHDASDTTIRDAAGGGFTDTQRLCIREVRIEQTSGAFGDFILNSTQYGRLWMDSNTIVGAGRWLERAGPVNPTKWSETYYTNCNITAVDEAMQLASLMIGNYVHSIGHDFADNCPVVIGNTVDDIDPGVTGWHSDFYQTSGGFGDNIIIYDNTVSNLHYQCFWIQFDNGGVEPSVETGIHGIAIVNNTINGNVDGFGAAAWSEYADHVLWWGNRFNIFTFTLSKESNGDVWLPRITHFSVRDNYFRQFVADPVHVQYVDFDYWDNNQFDIIAGDPGAEPFATGLIGTNASHV